MYARYYCVWVGIESPTLYTYIHTHILASLLRSSHVVHLYLQSTVLSVWPVILHLTTRCPWTFFMSIIPLAHLFLISSHLTFTPVPLSFFLFLWLVYWQVATSMKVCYRHLSSFNVISLPFTITHFSFICPSSHKLQFIFHKFFIRFSASNSSSMWMLWMWWLKENCSILPFTLEEPCLGLLFHMTLLSSLGRVIWCWKINMTKLCPPPLTSVLSGSSNITNGVVWLIAGCRCVQLWTRKGQRSTEHICMEGFLENTDLPKTEFTQKFKKEMMWRKCIQYNFTHWRFSHLNGLENLQYE